MGISGVWGWDWIGWDGMNGTLLCKFMYVSMHGDGMVWHGHGIGVE